MKAADATNPLLLDEQMMTAIGIAVVVLISIMVFAGFMCRKSTAKEEETRPRGKHTVVPSHSQTNSSTLDRSTYSAVASPSSVSPRSQESREASPTPPPPSNPQLETGYSAESGIIPADSPSPSAPLPDSNQYAE